LNSVTSLEAAIDLNNRLTFLLDWELTMKCNLDCDYCPSHLYGGHDNSQRHPPLEDCLRTIDFMYQYVDKLMSQRISGMRHVILNVYGGESLHHPNIVAILEAARQKHLLYQDRWSLMIGTTTNAIVTRKKMAKIVPLIDKFTVSYHSETLPVQKELFRENILQISQAKRDVQCVVLMHNDLELFADSQQQIAWCEQNNIRYLPRQLDQDQSASKFNYTDQQVVWFDRLYKQRSHSNTQTMPELSRDENHNVDLADTGRACCGGRQLCENGNHGDRKFFVANKFPGWYCSVDKFFLYVKQTTGEVFVNKDCKMNYDGKKGAIGNLSQCESILDTVGQTPTIQCAKARCVCGLCAPKAKDISVYNKIMSKYLL
jgi:hypothetical protein